VGKLIQGEKYKILPKGRKINNNNTVPVGETKEAVGRMTKCAKI